MIEVKFSPDPTEHQDDQWLVLRDGKPIAWHIKSEADARLMAAALAGNNLLDFTIEAMEWRKAARALVTKLDECKPHIDAAFTNDFIHGARYEGPSYGEALEALRALLPKERE